MANGGRETHRHFILEGVTQTERYRSRGGGSSRPVLPQENRPEHAARLRTGLADARAAADRLALEGDEPVEGPGIQVEFAGFPDLELAFEKLPHEGKGIVGLGRWAGRTQAHYGLQVRIVWYGLETSDIGVHARQEGP